jgi:hypothetical protein
MRTPKIDALHRLIDWFNSRLADEFKITKLDLDSSSLDANPWLAGFIEADGNFYCEYKLTSDGSCAYLLKNYMRISQKQKYSLINKIDNSNYPIMDKIKRFLDVKNVIEIERIKSDYTELSYEVRTTKKSSCDLLINYLTKFPLFSSKNLDFLDWKEFHNIRISKAYKTLKGTSKLISLKNSMNTKRTQFNWDSLNKFYC